MEYYTYAYLREDGTPYYIGKGKKDRIHSPNRRLKLPPKERRIFLKKNIAEAEAFKHEIYMIAVFGRKDLGTGILLNMSDGGEGSSGAVRSEGFKKNLSKIHKGKILSKETRRRLSVSNKKAKEGECKKFIITFVDGRQIIIIGIKRWMRENNYNYSCISRLRNGEYKKHKDIVAVEKLNTTP